MTPTPPAVSSAASLSVGPERRRGAAAGRPGVHADHIDNAVKSRPFGFSFDATSVRTQVSSVNNVITQYFNALTNGELAPSTMIDEFNTALEAAGLNDIIAEKQAQLDAWAAAQQS